MIADLELQRLYDRVRLVQGRGDRRSGTLCIMTFVALLAGERHTDAPSTASPLIRQFAVAINDAMPDTERQRLKPFAPRIIGTADGFDPGRAALLRSAMQQTVFPRIYSDLREGILPPGPLYPSCAAATGQSAREALCGFAAAAAAEDTPRNQRQLALLAARLLSACAASATTPPAQAWYWAQGINLLDQLCDVGMPHLRCGPPRARIEKLLAADSLAAGSRGRMMAVLRQVAHALAARIGTAATAAEPLAPPIAPPPLRLESDAPPAGRAVPLVPGA